MNTLIRMIESYLGRFLLWVVAVLLIALLYAEKTASPGQWTAGDWEAFGTVVTATIAVVAAAVAVVQLKDARDVRWEQALPYVAAYLDPDPTDPKLIYLTVKNFGATIAEDVELGITPEATRSAGVGGGTLSLPANIPALVPGQEWRTFWDFSVYRFQERMLKRHVLAISYADSRGTRHTMDSVLDWESYTLGRRWVGRKSIHHVGESVAKIEKSIGKLAKAVAGANKTHEYADPAAIFGPIPATSLPPDADVLNSLDMETEGSTSHDTKDEIVGTVAVNLGESEQQVGDVSEADDSEPDQA